MRETQKTINAWAEETFGPIDAHGAFLRCADEFAELAEVLGFKAIGSALKHEIEWARNPLWPPRALNASQENQTAIECADVLITLYRVTEKLGGELGADVDEKMLKNRARRWAITGPGIGQHVPESVDG